MRKLLLLSWFCGCGPAPEETLHIAAQTFAASVAASQVKSYELWVLAQVGRDSNPIQCADLLSRTITPASDNVLKVLSPIDGNFSTAILVKNIPNGVQDRVFYIDLYDQPGQLGQRIGAGCTASVTISGGKTAKIEIDISAPAR